MLTDVEAKRAKAGDKDYKLADAGGLYLFVSKSGHRSWRLKYRFGGKERRLVFGSYPDVSISTARQLREDAKRLIKEGRDPAYERKKAKLVRAVERTHTLEHVARSWFEEQKARWVPVHAKDVITSLERDVFPILGEIAIVDVTKRMILDVLKGVQGRGAKETGQRIRQRVQAVLDYAEREEFIEASPKIGSKDLTGVPAGRRWPALTDLAKIHPLMAAVDSAGANPVTKLASRMMALTAQRPGTVRGAKWSEIEGIDWSEPSVPAPAALWRIPPARMKLDADQRDDDAMEHIVPLSAASVDLLTAINRLTGRGKLVFPMNRAATGTLSENAVGYLYNRLGFKDIHVAHGWRSSFSTIMNSHFASLYPVGTKPQMIIERLYIDLMLAHRPEGMSATEFRYNRAAYMEQRRQIAELWAGMIMKGRVSAHDLLDGPRRPLSHTR